MVITWVLLVHPRQLCYNSKIGCNGVIVLNQRIIKLKIVYLVHFRLNLLILDFSNLVARNKLISIENLRKR
jgi:hypothetical protein